MTTTCETIDCHQPAAEIVILFGVPLALCECCHLFAVAATRLHTGGG